MTPLQVWFNQKHVKGCTTFSCVNRCPEFPKFLRRWASDLEKKYGKRKRRA